MSRTSRLCCRSAALAAAFNTPIAAVLFSLEEIMGHLHAPVMGSVVISSATSWLVLHLILGDEPLYIRSRFKLLPKSTLWLQPVAGGLTVGLLGWYKPEVLGVGYDYVERVLRGDLALQTVAILASLKIIATATCYGSGNAGGIFGPSLFIGAMIGGAVGSVAHTLAPGITANPGAYH